MLQCVYLLFKNHIYVIHTYIQQMLLAPGGCSHPDSTGLLLSPPHGCHIQRNRIGSQVVEPGPGLHIGRLQQRDVDSPGVPQRLHSRHTTEVRTDSCILLYIKIHTARIYT